MFFKLLKDMFWPELETPEKPAQPQQPPVAKTPPAEAPKAPVEEQKTEKPAEPPKPSVVDQKPEKQEPAASPKPPVAENKPPVAEKKPEKQEPAASPKPPVAEKKPPVAEKKPEKQEPAESTKPPVTEVKSTAPKKATTSAKKVATKSKESSESWLKSQEHMNFITLFENGISEKILNQDDEWESKLKEKKIEFTKKLVKGGYLESPSSSSISLDLSCTVPELKKFLKENSLTVSGKKSELVDRLLTIGEKKLGSIIKGIPKSYILTQKGKKLLK